MAVIHHEIDVVTVCWCADTQIRAKDARTLFKPRSPNCRVCRHDPRPILLMPLHKYFSALGPQDRRMLLWHLSQSRCPNLPQSPQIRVWGSGPWASILGIEEPRSYSPWLHFHIDLEPADQFLREFRQLNDHLSDLDIAKDVRYQAFLKKQTVDFQDLEHTAMGKTIPESCESVLWLRDHGPRGSYGQIAKALEEPHRLDKKSPLGFHLSRVPLQLARQYKFATPGNHPPMLSKTTWVESPLA